MNPLFLLLGLFGASVAYGSSSTETDPDPTDTIDTTSGLLKGGNGKDKTPAKGKDTTPVTDEPGDTEPTDTEEPIEDSETPTPAPEPDVPEQPEDPEEPTASEPEVPEQPEEPTTPLPEAPQQPGDGGSGAETTPTAINDGTVEVMAGRVATLQPSEDVTDIRILSGVEHGNVTVNSDNTFALVMTQSDFIGQQSFTYEATHADGSVTVHEIGLNVTEGLQEGGWGTGESHYMLATDADDKVIVEHGENHMKVYVSGAQDAWSLADIADAEGMSVSQVTGEFLANHGTYGQSESMALAEDAGNALWSEVSGDFSETSNWLLFERGYEYGDVHLLARGASGEGELNPLYIGAWGEGDRPEITSYADGYLNNNTSSNIVLQDLHFSGGYRVLSTENIIFDGIKVTDEQLVTMHSSGVTVRNSEFYDNTTDASKSDGDTWVGHLDRQQGYFANYNEGMLIEGLFLDHNGWEDGYDPYGSVDDPMPPSMYSHNLYFGTSIDDLTARDIISMRGSATGLLLRSGGFYEDLVLIDNNSGIVFKGGDHADEGQTGYYTLLTDSLVTSGGHRWSDITNGGLTFGVRDEGELTSLVDNIVTHLADPNNQAEQDAKTTTHDGLTNENPYYNDTIVYNWEYDEPGSDQNTEGLDTAVLDQTTIQNFTAQLLGKPDATIADLADYLRAQGDGAFDDVVDADLILRFFQEGFGVEADIRGVDTMLRFEPNDLAEGVRWDNRLNWDTEDLPGLYAEDDVDLAGNHVVFGTNTTIDMLDFGAGGMLNVYGGRLEVTGGITGDDSGSLNVEGAGQAWVDGSDADGLDVTVQGGRFVNTGTLSNTDITASGGQTVLATGGAEYDLGAGDTLKVVGDADVGFDGDNGDIAILDMQEDAILAFTADAGNLGTIAEFRTGAFEDTPDVQSGIDLGDGTLQIDLAGLSASDGQAFTLMDADELVGFFKEVDVTGISNMNARIVVDYQSDSVTLELTSGNGAVSVDTIGEQTDVSSDHQALWEALTMGQSLNADAPQDADQMLEDEVLMIA